jgi:hypothetical protein
VAGPWHRAAAEGRGQRELTLPRLLPIGCHGLSMQRERLDGQLGRKSPATPRQGSCGGAGVAPPRVEEPRPEPSPAPALREAPLRMAPVPRPPAPAPRPPAREGEKR